jgi:hypothetical protein
MKSFNGHNKDYKRIKIEFLNNYTFLFKMISFMDLVKNKKYYVKTRESISYRVKSPNGIYKGMIFIVYDYERRDGHIIRTYPVFINSTETECYVFYEEDDYYDPDKIKENAQKARQQMEQRSLDIILKKLVNEEFQW